MSEQLYNIEKILERRKVNGRTEYKIKWEGYPMSQCTWEPFSNLETAKELVEEFDRLHPLPVPVKYKSEKKTKTNSLIGKKRNLSPLENGNNENIMQENVVNLNNTQNPIKINEEDSKSDIKEVNDENKDGKTYIIDDNLKAVITVKQQSETLVAIVEKLDEKGELVKVNIPTDELRRTNPWILLNFYESKIKFT